MAILSMTGYSSMVRELDGGNVSVELRSVNHRYLDLQVRLPEDLRHLEPAIREMLTGKLTRGKLECRVSYSAQDTAQSSLDIDSAALSKLLQAAQQVQSVSPQSAALSAAEILRWPGIVVSHHDDFPMELIAQGVLTVLEEVLDDFSLSRGREGEKLTHFILERVKQMEALVLEVAPKIPALVAIYQGKLAARLRDVLLGEDDDRLRQELAMFAQKIDVEEEIGRLQTHLGEVRRILTAGGAVGKRLDFMMQELNREANTLGSKSVSPDITKIAMELKVLIEQMREQVQNIE